ncbi:hypothetical protein HRbin02_01561 [Candidatus Calditenuaceae archaeon HR02]|nr:hypothetical protein HRbin02_01561 [Candidatus Calditenuaceae archaeon HR02]
MHYRLILAIAVTIGIAYFLLFAYLSGGIQYFELPSIGAVTPTAVFVYYESQSYTGPGLQLFYDESMISVRILVVLLGVSLALLVSLNVLMLFRLWILGQLKSCLVRGSGTGLAVLLSSIASATYTCCGWAPTVAILGVSLASSLGLAPALASAALLAFNAAILYRRLSFAQNVALRRR